MSSFIVSLICLAIVALPGLLLQVKRRARVRKGREELERCEDSKRMLDRLRETLQGDGLATLMEDRSSLCS
jgi:hypothetical protein